MQNADNGNYKELEKIFRNAFEESIKEIEINLQKTCYNIKVSYLGLLLLLIIWKNHLLKLSKDY